MEKFFINWSEQFIEKITQVKFTGLYTADVCSGYLLKDIFAFASKKIIMPKIVEKIIGHRSYMWPCG